MLELLYKLLESIFQVFDFLLAASWLFARADLGRVHLASVIVSDDVIVVCIDDTSVRVCVILKKIAFDIVARFLTVAGTI